MNNYVRSRIHLDEYDNWERLKVLTIDSGVHKVWLVVNTDNWFQSVVSDRAKEGIEEELYG